MFSKKKVLAILLLAVLLLSIAGCGGGEKQPEGEQTPESGETADSKYGGTLRFPLEQDPPGIDVQQSSMLETYSLGRLIYSTLVRYKGDTTELEPELLEKMPDVSPDGLVYHFKLRPGLKFSDGIPLTSKDVKYTFERMFKPETKAVNQWALDIIAGAADVQDGKTQELSGIKIINDEEFEITLREAYAPFIQNLAVACCSVYPAEAAAKEGDNWKLNPIGSGPYRIAEWAHDQYILFEKNPYYFEEGLPYIDYIRRDIIPDEATRTMEFESGNAEVLSVPDTEYPRLAADDKFKHMLVENIPLSSYYYSPNYNIKEFQDKRVRLAMAHAIDSEKIVKELLNNAGVVSKGILGPGIPGYNPDNPGFEYNPEKAKQLMTEAGYPNGFKVENWQSKDETFYRRNIAIQAMLKEIGIEMEIQQMDAASWRQARAEGKIPLHLGNWWADIPDPDNYMYTLLHSTQDPLRSLNYKNPKVDELIEKARTLNDMDERVKLYQEAEMIAIYEDVALIPIFHKIEYYIVQPYVKDVKFTPIGVGTYNFKTMWLEKK